MKKALKIFGIILASLALIFGIFVIVNQVGEKQMNKYIDTFSAVEVEGALTPVLEDGEYYFTTDRDFRVMQLTDVHLGGGFLSRQEDKMTINAIAAMVSEEKPDLVIVQVTFLLLFLTLAVPSTMPSRTACSNVLWSVLAFRGRLFLAITIPRRTTTITVWR